MTPKEKAKELVYKFNFEHTGETYVLHQTVNESKRCALIAVDEILESHYKLLSGVNTSIYKYWQEVKQEIEKL